MAGKPKEIRLCPKCGRKYEGYSALSRVDNKTNICSDCGIREALQSIGMSPEELICVYQNEKN